jgi:hypothetical protein
MLEHELDLRWMRMTLRVSPLRDPVDGVERPKVPCRSLKLEFLGQAESRPLMRACLDTEIGRRTGLRLAPAPPSPGFY